eukprot:TRINITY_DN3142_c0_g1_i1.p1 TRINITY_DN3142_c0_g1~~TRINITY_DN3142_c0_g1_i1.p1  ORF type:complete len:315 (+),score=61.58 TRINITY_DN3142_c0_g1_i1:169-1113(+)
MRKGSSKLKLAVVAIFGLLNVLMLANCVEQQPAYAVLQHCPRKLFNHRYFSGGYMDYNPRLSLVRRHVRDEDAEELLGLGVRRSEDNPFDLLGLPRNAEEALVRPAFTKLAGTLHPDVAGTGDAEAFRKVLWAYRQLSDPKSRSRWVKKPPRFVNRKHFVEDDDLADLIQNDEAFRDLAEELGLDEWEAMLRARQKKADERFKQSQVSLVRSLIEGSYKEDGANHGRPIYRKRFKGYEESVSIYYWDERDGADCDGWWIGASVGGDMVFAFNINQAAMKPPAAGWRFPLRGPVDETLRVELEPDGGVRLFFEQT